MSDNESVGSLKDFIVKDASDVESIESERPVKRAKKEDPEVLNLMKEEAEKFAQNVQGTVVNGRTLRNREPESIEKRKPKDEYYERFGRAEEGRLLEKFTKKDIIDYMKSLEKDYKEDYEARGVVWPKLTMKMSLAEIREHYDGVKAFADLPDSDEESSEDEDGSEEEGSSEEEDSDEDSEDADDDADEDADEDSEDADEDASDSEEESEDDSDE